MSIVIVGGHDRMVGQYKKSANLINANVKYLHRWKPTSEKDRMSGSSGTFYKYCIP